jgi:tetratricopeptide (TPR) repeat protein
MEETRYLDFDLSIERVGENAYRARVLSSPAGLARVDFTLPVSTLEIENFVLKIGLSRRNLRRIETAAMEAAKDFGGKLYKAVFSDEVQSALRLSLDAARQQGSGLRLRLRLTEAPELANIPWEYLYNPGLNRFLALSVSTPVVRYMELPERILPMSVKPPLKVLVLIASPKDYPALDVEREWQNLKEASGALEQSGLLVLERLPTPSPLALQYALRRSDYQIFHFIGHGCFDEHTQDGLLLLEDESGRGRPLSGQHLGTILHDAESLRLVVLNACEGARTGCNDPFAGAAQSLLQQGLPVVVAMQFAITDQAAITFAREFYTAVADGLPADAAVAEARKVIFSSGNEIEWGTPVLYMRAPDGRVFDLPRSELRQPALTAMPRPDLSDSQVSLRVDPLYVDALGAFYVDQYEKAIELFQQVLAIRPNYLDAPQKLAEAQHQLAMRKLYQQAQAAIESGDWSGALEPLEGLVAQDPKFMNAATLLEKARLQAQLSGLYTNARKLAAAKQWKAALKVFDQIAALDPEYPDPDDLRKTVEAELAEQQHQAGLAGLYAEAVKQINEGEWEAARERLVKLQESEPGYRNTTRLLEKVDQQIEEAADQARAEAESKRLAAEQAEAARKAEAERLANENRLAQARAEDERLAQEKGEAERKKVVETRLAQEKLETARLAEENRLAQARVEEERLAHEKAKAARSAAEKAQSERLAREQVTAQPIAWEKAELVKDIKSPLMEYTERKEEIMSEAVQPNPWQAVGLVTLGWLVSWDGIWYLLSNIYSSTLSKSSTLLIVFILGFTTGVLVGIATRWMGVHLQRAPIAAGGLAWGIGNSLAFYLIATSMFSGNTSSGVISLLLGGLLITLPGPYAIAVAMARVDPAIPVRRLATGWLVGIIANILVLLPFTGIDLASSPLFYFWLSLLGLPTCLIAGIWMYRTVRKAT